MVCLAIGNELDVRPLPGILYFCQDGSVAFPGKKEGARRILDTDALIDQNVDFIDKRNPADAGRDIVHGRDHIRQMEQRADACPAPWVAAPASRDRGEEQGGNGLQLCNVCGEDFNARLIRREHKTREAQAPLDCLCVIGWRDIWQFFSIQHLEQLFSLFCEYKGAACPMPFDHAGTNQIFHFCIVG